MPFLVLTYSKRHHNKRDIAYCPSFYSCCLVLLLFLPFCVLAFMAIEAENMCFENMGFGTYTVSDAQDCFFMGSGMGIQDGFSGQEEQHLYLQDSRDNYVGTASSSSSFCGGSVLQSLSTELQRQIVETDCFLQMENQRLRSSILLEASRQRAVIIQSYESRLKTLMLQMDERIAIARNRATQLRSSLHIAELESQSWQKKAAENEATATHLRNRLTAAAGAHERETPSSCGSSTSNPTSENEAGDEEYLDLANNMSCKLCQTRILCSVFFPCRHLCCCKACEPLLGHCPVCGTVKEQSLDVVDGRKKLTFLGVQ